uniref:Uncharacterized protein n=1 Tax=Parascaris univalens TaxID=6257 RepID=A0A915BHI5_PARUN
MADSLEDDSEGDSDRRMDSRGFQKEKFDIFVDEYRENATPRAGSLKRSDTRCDAALKKDVVNTKRKLNRAKYAIEAMPDSHLLMEYIGKIDSTVKELDELVLGRKEPDGEFTIHSVPLPTYDSKDMELLFGQEGSRSESDDSIHYLSLFERTHRERVLEVLGAAEILLSEYEEIMRQRKSAALH